MKITSLKNPEIKNIVKLRNHKARREAGITIVEGYREILQAIETGVDFKEIFFCIDKEKPNKATVEDNQKVLNRIIKKFNSSKVKVYEVTSQVFSKISYGDQNEGILAICKPKISKLNNVTLKENPLIVIVEAIEKPGNLGAIMRTCDGAKVDLLIVCDQKTDVYNPNVIRASLGAVFTVPIVIASNDDTLNFLKSKSVRICATTPKSNILYSKEDLSESLAIIVGSEDIGLSDFWLKECDVQVKIPMKGKVDSLNVSTSTAILLYEAIRQRNK